MANKCRNQITITGSDASLDQLLSRAGKRFSLERLFPTPSDLLEDHRWYEWRIAHWGIKWDLTNVIQRRSAGAVEVRGLTPWAPPSAALQTLSSEYPDLQIRVTYRDQDLGTSGKVTFVAGARLR